MDKKNEKKKESKRVREKPLQLRPCYLTCHFTLFEFHFTDGALSSYLLGLHVYLSKEPLAEAPREEMYSRIIR